MNPIQLKEMEVPITQHADCWGITPQEAVASLRMGNKSWAFHEDIALPKFVWDVNDNEYRFETEQENNAPWDGYLAPTKRRHYIPAAERAGLTAKKIVPDKKYKVFCRQLTDSGINFPRSIDRGGRRHTTSERIREVLKSYPFFIVPDITQISLERPIYYYYLIPNRYLLQEFDEDRLRVSGWNPGRFYDFIDYYVPGLLPEHLHV